MDHHLGEDPVEDIYTDRWKQLQREFLGESIYGGGMGGRGGGVTTSKSTRRVSSEIKPHIR